MEETGVSVEALLTQAQDALVQKNVRRLEAFHNLLLASQNILWKRMEKEPDQGKRLKMMQSLLQLVESNLFKQAPQLQPGAAKERNYYGD